MQNSVISNIITIYHWSKTSPIVLCMQNNVNSIVITSLYESQPSFVFFACKTATFESELQVSMDPRPQLSFCEMENSVSPRPHVWFFTFKTAYLSPKLQVSLGTRPHLWFCALTTAALSPELIVSMGPRPHLSFCACNAA